MAKRRRPMPLPQPQPAIATAARFDGGALRIEIVLQPEAARRLADQLVNALFAEGDANGRR